MKSLKIHLLAAIVVISTGKLCAQLCPQEVITDPRNPSNPDRPALENTFFWFPHNGTNHANFDMRISGGIHYPSIASPFWNDTDLQVGALFDLQNSDFWPEDGWELLKVNFGYLNDGTQREVLPAMPYMALYNKYTGTIRFLGMWPNASNSWQIIRFNVSLPKKKRIAGGSPDTPSDPLDATNLLSIQGDAAQPLDQQTDENVYEIIAEYPGISNASYFFWFDMPVAYDPCVCYNDVAIQLTASVENNWNLTIKGTLDAQVLQQGSPTGNNHSALTAKRIIGAAGATATAIITGGAIVQTGPIISLIDIFSQRPGISGQAQRNLELLKQTMNAASTAVWDPVKMQWRNTVTDSTMTKSDWDKLFAGIGSFLNAGVDYLSPSARTSSPRTSVVGTITATGTASLNAPTGDVVYLGVPGSKWTNTLSEVISPSPATVPVTPGGILPEYPIYNNALGTFALLKTPTLTAYKLPGYVQLYSCATSGTTIYNCVSNQSQRIQVFLKDQPILYRFNPTLNINEERTKIYASIVMKENAKNFAKTDCIDIENNTCCFSSQISCEQQWLWARGLNIYPGIDPRERITNPVPLEYISQVLAEFTIDGFGNFDDFDYFLRFSIDYESHNIGRDGNPIKDNMIITFPLLSESSTESPPITMVDIENDQISSVIGGPDGIVVIVGKKFRSGYIEISGFLTSFPNSSASVLSTDVIHIKPGAHITDDLRLAIDYPFTGQYPQAQTTQTFVNDFCTGQVPDLLYQANQFSAKARDLPPLPYELLKPYLEVQNQIESQIELHPNPTSGLLQITSSNAPINQIEVYDLSGRRLYHQSFGNSPGRQVQADLSALSNGVYVVKTTSGGVVSTEKLVVGR
jgi:hypothetical protein